MRVLMLSVAAGAMFCAADGNSQDRGVSVGNGFLARCKSPVGEANAAFCAGYVRGLVDGVVGTWGLGCSPQSATYQQRYDILLKHLTDYPASRHLDMVTLYSAAMVTAFCPTGLIEVEPLK